MPGIKCLAMRGYNRAARPGLLAAAAVLAAAPLAAAPEPPVVHHAEQLKRAREDIKHIIIIMQENRSFDSYFGTFPGANGIVKGTCVPLDPNKTNKRCVKPYHDPHDVNAAATHRSGDTQSDIDDGITTAKMDGFVKVQTNSVNGNTGCKPDDKRSFCIAVYQGVARHDVVGYHTGEDIPNYWAYAKNFVLQDALFDGIRSWSFPSHLDLASEWSANCTDPLDALSCTTTTSPDNAGKGNSATLPWANLYLLLDLHQVSWKYYVAAGGEPDCEDGEMACGTKPQLPGIGSGWNPTPLFASVQAQGADYLAQHNPSLQQFYNDLAAGTLPQVSWIVPAGGDAEHPPDRITKGMQHVTSIVNAVMQSSAWSSSVIFISWDDWGGFYDHVDPPNVDTNDTDTPIQGFGLRVPGLMISPYAQKGKIDSSVLSFDSYATFIEDVFADSARLDPTALGIPDNRPDIRDEMTTVSYIDGTTAAVGDLLNEFNFSQQPRAPMILSTAIPNELVTKCGASIANGFLCTSPNVGLAWLPVTQGTGTPPYTYHVTRDAIELPGCAGTKTKCNDTPGPGNHLYRVYSVDSTGVVSPQSAAFEADEPTQGERRKRH